MLRFLRCARALPVLALVLCLFGCAPVWLVVRIPDFGTNQIQGVWVWRFSPQTNAFERDTLILFQGVTLLSSGPTLSYTTYSNQGDLSLTAAIHSATNPNGVTMTLGFERGATGVFKVSTYNAVGESQLSLQWERL